MDSCSKSYRMGTYHHRIDSEVVVQTKHFLVVELSCYCCYSIRSLGLWLGSPEVEEVEKTAVVPCEAGVQICRN